MSGQFGRKPLDNLDEEMIRQVATRRKSTNETSCEHVTELDEEKMDVLLLGSESTQNVWTKRKRFNGKSLEKVVFERSENVVPAAVELF